MIVWTKKDIRCEGVGIFNIRKSLVYVKCKYRNTHIDVTIKSWRKFCSAQFFAKSPCLIYVSRSHLSRSTDFTAICTENFTENFSLTSSQLETLNTMSADAIDTVKFNVGGRHFEVSRALVDDYSDTVLGKLVSDTWMEDREKVVFIDRSGDIFAFVLEYLRYGR